MSSRRKRAFRLALLLGLVSGSLAVLAGAGEPAQAAAGGADCGACHPGPAKDWQKSAMAQSLDCTVCHGKGHQGADDYRNAGLPTPNTCRPCHEQRVREFEEGKHSYAWLALNEVPNYRRLPASVKGNGCDGCHQVGLVWPDGSRGKCNACHGRHAFSKREAAEPGACGYCHRGDHPQYKMWEGSRHGQLYLQTRDESRAPKCQTCHVSNGSHNLVTAWGFLGLRGEEPDQEWAKLRQPIERALKELGPANAPKVKRATLKEWQEARETMVQTCAGCHSRTFAEEKLNQADQQLKESDRLFSLICATSYQLRDRGVLDEQARGALVRESLAHRFSSYMGSFHGAYEYAWDDGFLALSDDLLKLRSGEYDL
jgi:hypothetical protein